MKSVKIATLKDELSMHVRSVERGASYIVTDRDRPVAQLVPIVQDEGFELVEASVAFDGTRRFPKVRAQFDSLALLLLERGDR
jgi:prevent-host-death family protein